MAFLTGLLTAKTAAYTAIGAAAAYFIHKRCQGGMWLPQNYASTDLSGKTVIITGANTGIGYESAVAMAGMGATVIMACRDEKKALEAIKSLQERLSAPGANPDSKTGKPRAMGKVEFMSLDLNDLESIRKFIAVYKSKYDRCHVLMNNAGVMMCPEWKTAQGIEMQFGCNHIGHFALTTGLLDLLKASAPARIVNVSSNAHRNGVIDIDDLDWKKRRYSPITSYAQSKLANILFTEELGRRLAGTGVTAYSLHPGVVRTELSRHLPSWVKYIVAPVLSPILLLTLKSPYAGAQTQMYCALAPECANESGLYYSDCAVAKPKAAQAGNADLAKKLWEVSEKLITK